MLSKKYPLLIVLAMFLFPGCIKYYKLSKSEFPQGKDQPDKHKEIKENIKDVAIFDQFETKARFNIMHLSDEVRTAYVDLHCLKRGKDEQDREALLRRQLEENRHWMTFYVLAEVRDKTHLSLTDKNSSWSFYVKVDEKQKVMPISIKEVDVEPEYQALFGHRFNLFKRGYLIKFPAADLSGDAYLKKKAPFKMVVSSAYKLCEVSWNEEEDDEDDDFPLTLVSKKAKEAREQKRKEKKGKKPKKKKREKVLKDEDYYWL